MKRLIKKAFGKTVYHGTNIERLKEITSMGQITPNEATGAGSNGASSGVYDGYTFFATTINRAAEYAVHVGKKEGFVPVVLEIDIDEKALLPDDNDDPDAKVWQDSQDSMDQVKILGPIDTSYIRMVRFIDDNGYYIEETPFTQWEQVYEEKLKAKLENFDPNNLIEPF